MKQLIIITLVFSILFMSCGKKKKEERLKGSWQETFLSAADAGKDVVWIFSDDGTLSLTSKVADSTIIKTARYMLDPKTFRSSDLFIYDLGGDIDGTYQIIKNNSKVLIIQRTNLADGDEAAAYLFKEFSKKE